MAAMLLQDPWWHDRDFARHVPAPPGVTGIPLAIAYSDSGYHGKAESVFNDLIASSERSKGLGHPDTLALKTQLAHMFRKHGRLAESESLSRVVLAAHETELGSLEERIDRLKLKKTVDVFRVQRLTQRLAHHDEHVGRERIRFAKVLESERRYTEAEAILKDHLLTESKKVVATQKEINASAKSRTVDSFVFRVNLEAQTSSELSARIALARIIERQHRYTDAEAILREVLTAQTRVPKPEPDAGWAAFKGLWYDGQMGAQSLQDLKIKADNLVRVTKQCLARVLEAHGNFREAELVLKEVLDSMEAIEGANHIATVKTKARLAHLIFDQSRYAETQGLIEELLELAAFSGDDPEKLQMKQVLMCNLAETMRRQERQAILAYLVRRYEAAADTLGISDVQPTS